MQTSADYPLDLRDPVQPGRRPCLESLPVVARNTLGATPATPALWRQWIETLKYRHGGALPCPAPTVEPTRLEVCDLTVDDEQVSQSAFREGMIGALYGREGWNGFTAWGRAYGAGVAYGKQFV